jgi:hypothetical protein
MNWAGFSGAPGYTNLHFLLADTPTGTQLSETVTKVRTFFNAWGSFIPNGVSINFPSEIEQFDTNSGVLEGSFSVTPGAVVNGAASTAPYSSASGACITWNTAAVVAGRRLRGRTFMVPLAPTSAFQSDGTLAVAGLVTMRSAAQALADDATGMPLVVWHRPTLGGTDGLAGVVTGASITDKTAVLRSRRD